jgi:hypothetical protein
MISRKLMCWFILVTISYMKAMLSVTFNTRIDGFDSLKLYDIALWSMTETIKVLDKEGSVKVIEVVSDKNQ